jgi:hypothetical protein
MITNYWLLVMMVAKRSPERPSADLPCTKKLKVEAGQDVRGEKTDQEKSKSKKKNESILINPGVTVLYYLLYP